MALRHTLARGCGVHTSQLSALCNLVANCAHRRIPASKPITGADVFRHESGIHTAALLKDAAAYQPFPSEEIGRVQEPFAIGKHSGSAGIQSLLAASGISVPTSLYPELLSAVRRRAREHKRALNLPELKAIALESLNLATPPSNQFL